MATITAVQDVKQLTLNDLVKIPTAVCINGVSGFSLRAIKQSPARHGINVYVESHHERQILSRGKNADMLVSDFLMTINEIYGNRG